MLATGGAAQTNIRLDFLDTFNFALRVVQTPCPQAFTAIFDEPTCYLHAYNNVFDFKERFNSLIASLPRSGRLGYWHTVSLELGDEPTTAFRSRQSLRPGFQLTVTYLDTLVVLEGLK